MKTKTCINSKGPVTCLDNSKKDEAQAPSFLTANEWVAESCLMAYQETTSWIPTNEFDSWIKENRLRALQHLLEDTNGSSNVNSNCYEDRKDKNVVKSSHKSLPTLEVPLMDLKAKAGFMDSHCHIDFLLRNEKFNGSFAEYMAKHHRSVPASYRGCIAVFCNPDSFAKTSMWATHLQNEKVWGAFGCHPKSAQLYNNRVEKELLNALNHPKVRALGEIGLDYSDRSKCPRKKQHDVFRRQLKIALHRNLRVVVHCRDADDDAIRIMREVLPRDFVFHLHCFTGNWQRAQRWIKEFPNVYIGITNLVSFPTATDTHEVARSIPLSRLLLETDAPYFVPRKIYSKADASHPGMAIHVAEEIARLKNTDVQKVMSATLENTRVVYNLF